MTTAGMSSVVVTTSSALSGPASRRWRGGESDLATMEGTLDTESGSSRAAPRAAARFSVRRRLPRPWLGAHLWKAQNARLRPRRRRRAASMRPTGRLLQQAV